MAILLVLKLELAEEYPVEKTVKHYSHVQVNHFYDRISDIIFKLEIQIAYLRVLSKCFC